ncbi:MAG: hypothetical protein QOE70_1628 [Chthoniobacter sp.]|jgi:hypothetical protein|nr:hypothetical protein [Chthoniobacter sp.]
MKSTILVIALAILMSACAQNPKLRTGYTSVRQERVSDRYSRDAVKTYELFHTDIDGHVIMLVRLASGEQFPMLCRKTGGGIYPIPQSVFAVSGSERWSIMCEPRVHNAHALMRLELSRADGALFMGNRRLKSSAKAPLFS